MGSACRPLLALAFTLASAATPPLAWSVTDEGPLLGTPHWWHPADTDKDGSLVAARLAGATHGVADTRELAYTNVSRRADATYLADVAAVTVALYKSVAGPLLVVEDGPVVVGSVHRLVLWAAETLHSPALPAQAIAFADTWAEACDAAAGGDVVVLVGCDFGYDGLWLWLKPASAAGVPPAHLAALARASSLVLLRATDADTYLGAFACPATSSATAAAGGATVSLYVHSSLASCAADPAAFPRAAALYAAATPLPPLPPGINGSSLGQWEWGLPDLTVAAFEAAWAGLGKSPAALVRAEGGVVPGYLATPGLWSAYLGANGRAPRGLSLYSYWTAQPALDRADATLPLPSYAFYHPDFTPLVDAANATLAALVGSLGARTVAAHTRAFVNTVGSAQDPAAVEALLSSWDLLAPPGVGGGAWASLGLDCPPAACTTINGSAPLPCAHVYAAAALGGLAPGNGSYVPLSVPEVLAALAPFWPASPAG